MPVHCNFAIIKHTSFGGTNIMKQLAALAFFGLLLLVTGCDNAMEPIAPSGGNGTVSTSSASKAELAKGHRGGHNQWWTNDDNDDEDYHDSDCNHNGSWGGQGNCNDGSNCDSDGIVTLWAGKTMNAGTVTVTQDANNLYVEYKTSGTWKITETHLNISTSKFTQRGAPGQYPYSSSNGTGVTSYKYTIAKTWSAGTKLYFLAHAVVKQSWGNYCGSSQTAFGGTVVSPQCGSWYATFCTSVDGAPAPKYTISGAVFNDANGNGVKESGEAGLSGVTISLSNGATAVSDANGTYSFSNVPTGSYVVTAPAQSGYTQTTPASVNVTVTNANITANFGYKPVPVLFSIGGTVFNDLNQNGVFDSGEPGIAGVTVYLNITTLATTDANGAYTFSGLSTGSYSVIAGSVDGLNLTTPGSVTVALSSANSTVNFGFGQVVVPLAPVQGMKKDR